MDSIGSARELAQRFARAHRALRTAAVTGTNGKTTTTSMIAAIVAASGEVSARLTTLGAWVGDEPIAVRSPTLEFLHTVETAVQREVRTLALEVTSKALATGLARRWRPRVAVFTNLSRDHLDMHRSPEGYLAAKAQLFMALPPDGVAVLNGDDPATELLLEVMPRGVEIRRFSVQENENPTAADRRDTVSSATELMNGENLTAVTIDASARGTRVVLASSALAGRLGGVIELTVAGAVHAQNAMAAALAGDALGYSADAISRGLRGFSGVPGRFEIVGHEPLVVVDYAHTPDGLDGTLGTARQLVTGEGRLICVFGCGGDRDRGKRPEMGAIADRYSDIVVLTNDNPRFEDPATIAAEIQRGAQKPAARWITALDRRVAIERAIAMARSDDVVVIAGKGHEAEQESQGEKQPFSDVDVARRARADHRRQD